jgi:hypothetical protein
VCLSLRAALHPALAKNIKTSLRIVVHDRRFPAAFNQLKLPQDFKIPKYKVR